MKSKVLRILLAENILSETGMTLRSVCAEQGRGLELVFLSNRNSLGGALCRFHPHAAFIAMSLLQPEPYTAVSLLHYAAPRVPLILFATTADKECAAKCLEAGAHDYMVEGFIDDATMERTLRSAMQPPSEISVSGISEFDLDPLTGLLNRGGLMKCLRGSVRCSPLSDQPLIVSISLKSQATLRADTGGASADRALCQFGKRLQGCVRRNDLIAHLALGEFVLIIAEAGESCFSSLRRRLESFLRDFNFQNRQDTLQFHIRASCLSSRSTVALEEFIASHSASEGSAPLAFFEPASVSLRESVIWSGQ
jgi:GGDEF domain-containing protein